MKTQSFIKGAAILTLAGLLSKMLGALYRIPFFRVVGSEGMGLYQMAYPIYMILLAVSSAGIPVAISKLVSENLVRRDYRGVTKVFWISLVFIGIVSGTFAFLLFSGARFLADNVLHDSRAYYSILAIAPAVFFVGILSVFRGYFQGFQQMVPTAGSQVLEQLTRVITVLVGAYIFLPRGVQFASAAATFGAVTGALSGVLLLVAVYFFRPFWGSRPGFMKSPGQVKSKGSIEILNRVVVLALPISLGGLVLPVMQTLDAFTVPMRLQLAGFSVSEAAELYGELTGAAMTLINLPTVITISLAASLVPAIAQVMERKNYQEAKRQISLAVQITFLVCLPAAVGLAVLAGPISDLLFKCPRAGVPLAFLAPASLLLGLHQTTTGVLQGMGRTFLPVINLVIGAIVKFAINFSLTAIPQIGIVGAALGTVGGFMISSLMNCLFIRYYTGWTPDIKVMLLKPAAAVTIMALGVRLIYSWTGSILGNNMATILAVLSGALLYLLSLVWLGILRTLPAVGSGRFLRRILRIK